MDKALNEGFHLYQETIPLSGNIIKQKGQVFLDRLSPNESVTVSNGWLDSFKKRHHTSSTRRFGEGGPVDMNAVTQALPASQAKLNASKLKDIYHVDATGLDYHMLADHSLSSRQLEGRTHGKEWLTTVKCENGDGSDKQRLWIIG